MSDDEFLKAVVDELKQARASFPSSAASNAALVEEVGELSTALMYEPYGRVEREAIQVAAMACRIATEGDPTFAGFRWEKVHADGMRYGLDEHMMPRQRELVAGTETGPKANQF
jgi:hypothetical protein